MSPPCPPSHLLSNACESRPSKRHLCALLDFCLLLYARAPCLPTLLTKIINHLDAHSSTGEPSPRSRCLQIATLHTTFTPAAIAPSSNHQGDVSSTLPKQKRRCLVSESKETHSLPTRGTSDLDSTLKISQQTFFPSPFCVLVAFVCPTSAFIRQHLGP